MYSQIGDKDNPMTEKPLQLVDKLLVCVGLRTVDMLAPAGFHPLTIEP